MIFIAQNSDGITVSRWIKVESIDKHAGSDFVIPVKKDQWVTMRFKNGFRSGFIANSDLWINRSFEKINKPNTKAAQLID